MIYFASNSAWHIKVSDEEKSKTFDRRNSDKYYRICKSINSFMVYLLQQSQSISGLSSDDKYELQKAKKFWQNVNKTNFAFMLENYDPDVSSYYGLRPKHIRIGILSSVFRPKLYEQWMCAGMDFFSGTKQIKRVNTRIIPIRSKKCCDFGDLWHL